MNSPNHLPIDNATLIRIVGQAADALLDTRARLTSIIERVCPLIGALCGTAAIARSGQHGSPPEFDCFSSAGQWDDDIRNAFESYVAQGWSTDPAYPLAMNRLMPNGGALHRSDLLNDDHWYSCDHFRNCRKPAGVDGSIYAIAPIDHRGNYVAMSYHEKLGTRLPQAATDSVRTLVMGLSFIGDPYQREVEGRRLVSTLAPRLKDILACYQLGMSAKQAAAQLGIKRSSVQQYSKSLHKHFGVNTRLELIAKCRSLRIEATLEQRPWSPNVDIDPTFAKVLFPRQADTNTPPDPSPDHPA